MLTQFQPALWQQVFRKNFTRIDLLADFLELSAAQRQQLLASPSFSLNLPVRLAQKIGKGDLNDPILKQFLPTIQEKEIAPGYTQDPVGDCRAQEGPKLLRKYQGRVLLVCTSACAMHCRYCFRQNFDYKSEDKTFENEIKMIEQDTSIREVILSGGDPLSLPDWVLSSLLQKIGAIPHVTRIRFHTRFPLGIPERIDDDFVEMIRLVRKQVWFVIHANHPRELDKDVFARLNALQQCGVVVLNQSVLLRGVNDTADILQQLCELLVDNGILPYYLHQLDRVQGAAHFEVPEDEGKRLLAEIATRLPGYAVPKYVREVAGEPGKTPIL